MESEVINLNQGSSEETDRSARKAPAPKWQVAEVIGVIAETPETTTLRLAVPEPTEFVSGQYYNIRIPVEGRPRPIQRAYSIASPPFPQFDVVEFGIKEMEGGLVSPVLAKKTAVGDTLEVRGPYGAFVWSEDKGGPLLLISAGSGVVPFMSMIRYAKAKGLNVPMHLLFSSKSAEYVIYSQELKDLEAELDWLTVTHTFTRDPGHPGSRYHRRIDKEMVAELTAESQAKLAYICGPPEMVELCEVVLIDLGMDPQNVYSEKYD
ncbi:MAG: oxidoreductase [Acidimicrobiaceae bacterium]|nr:oxidoreductase [Acidimicrobiaceae bacterium]